MKVAHWIVLALAFGMSGTTLFGANNPYQAEVEAFRERREAELKAEDSWLTVAGLHWLKPGETTVGSDPSCDFKLPASAPAKLGHFSLSTEGKVAFQAEPGLALTLRGEPFQKGPIQSDADGAADVLSIGPLRLIVIKRGARLAIRLKDNQSELRKTFHGLAWFSVEERFKVQGKWKPSGKPGVLIFDTIVGEHDSVEFAGTVAFEIDGIPLSMDAAREGDSLWFVFRDKTSGKTTHGGARQLYAAIPKDGQTLVELDFNKATNLPCAYTAFATCPLAPPQNRLPIAMSAGEKTYHASN